MKQSLTRLWFFVVFIMLLAPMQGASAQRATAVSPHGPKVREACASCHRAEGWKPARITPAFKHAERTFPLTGAHERATCLSCHKSLTFQGAPNTCASCHSDPHKGEFGVSCARCHSTRSFVDRGASVRSHQGTRFPLRGAHAIATCESCHARTSAGQLQFAARSTSCESCHMTAFRATKSPSHTGAQFSTNCTSCHTLTTWTGATFDHNTTRFALTGRHAAATCQGCHADGVYRGRATTCVSCHQSDYANTREPKHAQGFPTTCESCHGTSQWKGATFDHQARTRFPLTGRHQSTTCASCHVNGVYAGTPSTCIGCHQAGYNATTKPPHQAARFATTCESCHTTTQWTGAPFDHNTTRFALTGGHRAVTCAGCHADNVYVGKPMTCASCHQGAAAATTNPHHTEARFTANCESCHTTTAWRGARFDHNTTRFPLTGRHVPATCLACHNDRVYAGKPSVCASCHQRDYDAAVTPNHRTLGFPSTCESCHTSAAWKPATFDHAATRFPLTGGHRTATCQSCHADGVYRGKSVTCVSCHQDRFNATTQPNHRTAGYATTCEGCHSVVSWKPAAVDHSRFPLVGAHRAVTCNSCHSDGVYRGRPSTCVSCHQAKFDATTRPNHRAASIPTICQSCHNETAWTPATFDHAATRFPLAGAHRAATCASCHSDGVYTGKPTTCVSCHQAKFNATTRPDHRAARMPTVCQSCHNETAWTPATFDHAATRFPLAGAHRAVGCASCHGDGVYTGKPTTCVSCHQAKFDATTRPNHRTSAFPTTCESCHTVTAWLPASFDHGTTRFPLVGAHRTATCVGCHSDGVYRGKPTTCVSCHQAKYTATTRPNHAANGIGTSCEGCHSSTAWLPATFNHGTTRFPLTGAHVSQTCLACHNDGVYRGKPTACASCHTTAYNATTNPNHRTAAFPMTCESCHSTTRWTGATFNHDGPWFPIYSGKHRGKWTTCTQCHQNSTNFREFTCLSCHEHNQTKMDSEHRGRSGYRYESVACYSCHPRGSS